MKTLRAPAKPVAPPVPQQMSKKLSSNTGMWQDMIKRTMDKGEDVKRG
jgi:hypothetical protein